MQSCHFCKFLFDSLRLNLLPTIRPPLPTHPSPLPALPQPQPPNQPHPKLHKELCPPIPNPQLPLQLG